MFYIHTTVQYTYHHHGSSATYCATGRDPPAEDLLPKNNTAHPIPLNVQQKTPAAAPKYDNAQQSSGGSHKQPAPSSGGFVKQMAESVISYQNLQARGRAVAPHAATHPSRRQSTLHTTKAKSVPVEQALPVQQNPPIAPRSHKKKTFGFKRTVDPELSHQDRLKDRVAARAVKRDANVHTLRTKQKLMTIESSPVQKMLAQAAVAANLPPVTVPPTV